MKDKTKKSIEKIYDALENVRNQSKESILQSQKELKYLRYLNAGDIIKHKEEILKLNDALSSYQHATDTIDRLKEKENNVAEMINDKNEEISIVHNLLNRFYRGLVLLNVIFNVKKQLRKRFSYIEYVEVCRAIKYINTLKLWFSAQLYISAYELTILNNYNSCQIIYILKDALDVALIDKLHIVDAINVVLRNNEKQIDKYETINA